MAALSMWSDGYRTGEIGAEEVASEAIDAAERVGVREAARSCAQAVAAAIDAMFREYSRR